MTIEFRELESETEVGQIFPLIQELNPDMTREHFDETLPHMLTHGYRCIGAFDGDTLMGVVAYWIHYQFWCGKFLEVDNLIVTDGARGTGLGKRLLRQVETKGHEEKCKIALAKVYAFNQDAHRFYFREGYRAPGQVFSKTLTMSEEEWTKAMETRAAA